MFFLENMLDIKIIFKGFLKNKISKFLEKIFFYEKCDPPVQMAFFRIFCRKRFFLSKFCEEIVVFLRVFKIN